MMGPMETQAELKDRKLRDLLDTIQFAESLSAKVHGMLDEARIFKTVVQEFAGSKRFTASILLLTEDGSKLRIVESSVPPKKRRAGEKVSGRRLKGHLIDLSKSRIYSQVVRDGETVKAYTGAIIRELFSAPLASLISKTMGYERQPAVLTPLWRRGKIIGTFAMSCPELAEHFLPSVRNLAQHISTALELAYEYAERQKAQQAMHRSSAKAKAFLQAMPDMMFQLRRDGTFFDFKPSPLWEPAVRPAEFLGRRIGEVLPKDVARRTLDSVEQALRTGDMQILDYTLPFPMPDGEIRNYEARIVVSGKDSVLAIVRDVTEHKRAERALQESEEKYRSLVENMPQIIYHMDTSGKILSVNQASRALLGLEPEEVLGRNFAEFIAEEALPQAMEDRKSLLQGRPLVAETTLMDKEANRRDVQFSAVPTMKDGEVLGTQGVVWDMTEQKRAERALKESEEKYRSLIENMPEVIYHVDSSGKIVSVNEACRSLLGLGPEDLIGRNFTDFVPEEIVPQTRADHERLLAQHRLAIEVAVVDTGGKRHDVEYSAVPIVKDGEIAGTQGIVRDITQQKVADEELRSSREKLRKLSSHLQSAREEERTRVAREIHDELGQALAGLKMDLSWLRDKLPKEQKLLRDKAKSMLAITDRTIQTVKRIYTELRPTLLDELGLTEAVEWQAEDFRNRTGTRCQLSIVPEHIDLDKDLSTAIFRVFQEALTNVARHAEATSVSVSLKERNGALELKVKDNGRGITEEQISHPESFGLAGMREYVHLFRGDIKISGIRNRGTTLTVTIPLDRHGGTHD